MFFILCYPIMCLFLTAFVVLESFCQFPIRFPWGLFQIYPYFWCVYGGMWVPHSLTLSSWIPFCCFCLFVCFLTKKSISLLGSSLFTLSIPSWSRLERLYVSRNLSYSSRLSNLLHITVYSILLCIFSYLCDISYFSSFISLFIWVLYISFLVSLDKGLSILFIFLKKQLLVSLIFSVVFIDLYFIYFFSCACFLLNCFSYSSFLKWRFRFSF